MAYCLWIAVAATTILNVVVRIHGHPSQQQMMQQPQQQSPMFQQQCPLIATEPSQNQCPQLKSLKYNPSSNTDQIQNWSVVKVTKMSQMSAGQNALDDAQLQKMFCGIFSNIANCQGVSYRVMNRGNNGFLAQTFAYDGRNQNLQPEERNFNLVDQNFEIYSVQGNNAQNVVTGLNQGTATPEETLFAAIAENSSGAWKMFALCDQSMAWVVAPSDELRNNPQYLDSYKTEIEGALQQIKSSMASMSQGTGAMSTNMTPPPTSLQNPLPIVSIFGTPSSMSPPAAASPPQSGGVQNAYGNNPVVGNDNATPHPEVQQPPNAVAYASVGSPTSPVPPPPATLLGNNPPPASPPSGVVIP